ncbi:MAG TPA: phosphotransferase, partial [Clostridia bacterium]|nr:phosphotransferase [Clostridia bacterium]
MFDIPGHRSFRKIEAVNKGWSDDKKFYIETEDDRKLLLRLSDISQYERKKSDFEIMEKAASLNVPMSLPVDFGVCDNDSKVYQLLTWIEGEDLEIILPNLTDMEQYRLGSKSGEALRLIHSIPAPSSSE